MFPCNCNVLYIVWCKNRESGGTGQFAKIRLRKTQQELDRLLPEIGLLDPVERLERLQPLERQALDYQTKV